MPTAIAAIFAGLTLVAVTFFTIVICKIEPNEITVAAAFLSAMVVFRSLEKETG